MVLIDRWLKENCTGRSAPLFQSDSDAVQTFQRNGRCVLRRNPEFDELMIQTVEDGLLDKDWGGIIYVMHWLEGDNVLPLYIGKAERRGVTQDLSFNLANIRNNQHAFGRWGYGLAYHMGDLSHAMSGEDAYKKPDRKYRRWVERLFVSTDPPTLRRPVQVALIGWYPHMTGPSGLRGSLPSIEKELIAQASDRYHTLLLNTNGR